MRGARTLEPGESSLAFSGSLQYGSTALSLGADLPLPQVGLEYRQAIQEDLDTGLHIYLFGLRSDLRYRFFRRDPLHLAFAPALGVSGLPMPGLILGNLDLDLPMVAQVDLSPSTSLVLAGRVLAREHVAWISVDTLGTGGSGRYELLAGGGVRFQVELGVLQLGAWGDAMANTTRGGPPWWMGGVDIGFLNPVREAAGHEGTGED